MLTNERSSCADSIPRIHVFFFGRGSWMAGTDAGHHGKGVTISANGVAEIFFPDSNERALFSDVCT